MSEADIVARLLAQANSTKPLKVTILGEEFTFNYRDLGWMGKNKAMSQAMEYYGEGNEIRGRINLDRYKFYCLSYMLVNPPFPITEKIIEAFDEETGAQFDEIIPNPFDTGTARVAATGKESEGYSEETPSPSPETPSSSVAS